MNKKYNTKRSKVRKCAIHGCSLIKRSSMAQTGLSNLREGMPHPTLDALVFCGFTPKGSERWRTEEEIQLDAERHKKHFNKTASKASKKNAARRRKASESFDKLADKLLTLHASCGITAKKFKSLAKGVRKRLLDAQPDIVIKDEADRDARMDACVSQLVADASSAHEEAVAAMKAKMARLTAVREALEIPAALSDECFKAKSENKKPLTQADLNDMSSSRYELPADYKQQFDV